MNLSEEIWEVVVSTIDDNNNGELHFEISSERFTRLDLASLCSTAGEIELPELIDTFERWRQEPHRSDSAPD